MQTSSLQTGSSWRARLIINSPGARPKDDHHKVVTVQHRLYRHCVLTDHNPLKAYCIATWHARLTIGVTAW